MKKEYLKPDVELVSFSADEEILSDNPEGSLGVDEILSGWE